MNEKKMCKIRKKKKKVDREKLINYEQKRK